MAASPSLSDLEAYLDEALPPDEMTRIEKQLRDDEALLERLVAIHARRDSGVHSLGEVWRRHRLSCPDRQRLGNYLLDTLDEAESTYVTFHIEVVGCRFCRANLDDLRRRQEESPHHVETRRRRYFQSSAGHLRKP